MFRSFLLAAIPGATLPLGRSTERRSCPLGYVSCQSRECGAISVVGTFRSDAQSRESSRASPMCSRIAMSNTANRRQDMTDTTRTVLIALGIALLVVVLLPLLFMGGMMAGMMGGMMGPMMGGASWIMPSLVLLVLVAGVALLVTGLRRQ